MGVNSKNSRNIAARTETQPKTRSTQPMNVAPKTRKPGRTDLGNKRDFLKYLRKEKIAHENPPSQRIIIGQMMFDFSDGYVNMFPAGKIQFRYSVKYTQPDEIYKKLILWYRFLAKYNYILNPSVKPPPFELTPPKKVYKKAKNEIDESRPMWRWNR